MRFLQGVIAVVLVFSIALMGCSASNTAKGGAIGAGAGGVRMRYPDLTLLRWLCRAKTDDRALDKKTKGQRPGRTTRSRRSCFPAAIPGIPT